MKNKRDLNGCYYDNRYNDLMDFFIYAKITIIALVIYLVNTALFWKLFVASYVLAGVGFVGVLIYVKVKSYLENKKIK